MEIQTATLEKRELEGEIAYLTHFFSSRGCEQVLVSHGWGSRLTLDEMWTEKPVPVASLTGYITESRREERFYLGESDLLISDPERRFRFVLCHESDIHFEGDPAAAAEVSAHWRERGFPVI